MLLRISAAYSDNTCKFKVKTIFEILPLLYHIIIFYVTCNLHMEENLLNLRDQLVESFFQFVTNYTNTSA